MAASRGEEKDANIESADDLIKELLPVSFATFTPAASLVSTNLQPLVARNVTFVSHNPTSTSESTRKGIVLTGEVKLELPLAQGKKKKKNKKNKNKEEPGIEVKEKDRGVANLLFDRDLYQRYFSHAKFFSLTLPKKFEKIEELVQSSQKQKNAADKIKDLLNAKGLIEEIIQLDPTHHIPYLILAPILFDLYSLRKNDDDQKYSILTVIETYDAVIKKGRVKAYTSESILHARVMKIYLTAHYVNKDEAKKELWKLLNYPNGQNSIDLTNFHLTIIETLIPLSDGIRTVRGLVARIKLLSLILRHLDDNKNNEKKRNYYTQLITHDLLQLMKICRLSETDLFSNKNLGLDTLALNATHKHDSSNRKILINRIELLFAKIEKLLNVPTEKEALNSCTAWLKLEFQKYATFESDPIPHLKQWQTALLLTLLEKETDPYLILQKVHLKGDEKNQIVLALVKLNQRLKSLESKSENDANKKLEKIQKKELQDCKQVIVELELMLLKIYDKKIAEMSDNLPKIPSQDDIKNYIAKIKNQIAEVERTLNKLKAYKIIPRQSQPHPDLDELVKSYQLQIKLLEHFTKEISKGLLTLDDIVYFNTYKCRQERIYSDRNTTFELPEENYEIVLLHIRGRNLVDSEKFKEAIPILNQAISKDLTYCYSYNTLAKAHLALNQQAEARRLCEKSIHIYPNVVAYVLLAECDSKLGSLQDMVENQLYALCLYDIQEGSWKDSEEMEALEYFCKYDDPIVKIEAAGAALEDKNYFEAFQLFSIALFKGAYEEDEDSRRSLHVNRLFCLSFIIIDHVVESKIIQHDWAKIISSHGLDKLETEECSKVVTIADNLLKKPDDKFKQFAKQILITLSDISQEAKKLLASLDQPVLNPPAPQTLSIESGKTEATMLQEPVVLEQRREPVDLTPVPFVNRRAERARLQREQDEAELAQRKEQEKALISTFTEAQKQERLNRAQAKKLDRRRKEKENHQSRLKTRDKKKIESPASDNENESKNNDISKSILVLPSVSSSSIVLSMLNAPTAAPPKVEEMSEDYVVDLPLNLVRRLQFVLKTLGAGNAFITGGTVEKIALRKEYEFDRDIDIVTNILPEYFKAKIPEFGKTSNLKPTYMWPASRALNIPRIEVYYRKFLQIDRRLRNFISKTLRISSIKVIGGFLVDVTPEPEDRKKMVKVVVTVSGMPAAFQSLYDRKLRLPPDVTEKESFNIDATRILQAVTICCKDGYSDEELDLQTHVPLIGKIISEKEDNKNFRSLQNIVVDALKSGYAATIFPKWISLGIANIIFYNLYLDIHCVMPFIKPIFEMQDTYNKHHPDDRQFSYSLVTIFASAIFFKRKGLMEANELVVAVTAYLEGNVVFQDCRIPHDLITTFIMGSSEKTSHAGNKPVTLYELLREHFKSEFPLRNQQSEVQVTESKSSPQVELQQPPSQHYRLYQAQQRALADNMERWKQAQVPAGYQLLEVPDPNQRGPIPSYTILRRPTS